MSNAEILRSGCTPNSISKPKLKVQRDSVKLPHPYDCPFAPLQPHIPTFALCSFPSHELPLLLPPDHLRLTPHTWTTPPPTWTSPPPAPEPAPLPHPNQPSTPPDQMRHPHLDKPPHLNYHQLHSPVPTPHPHLNHQPHSPTQRLYDRWNSHLNDVKKKDYNWVSM